MSTFKIKLCDLNDGDVNSLKSMFQLTSSQRKHVWEIVHSGPADLCLFSFESEKSIVAWQNHHSNTDGMSALFSTNLDVDVNVDLVLKKPLRTKNFSEVLDTAAEQLKSNSHPKHQAEELTLQEIYEADSVQTSQPAPPSSSPFNLNLPKQSEVTTDSTTDPIELKKVLAKILLLNRDEALINEVIDNLISLNRFNISLKIRLALLEEYRKATIHLMHNWEDRIRQLESLSQDDYLKSAHGLALLIDELAIGYKILLVESYEQDLHPESKESFLLAINRAAEYSSLDILHAYCFLRTAKPHVINTLYQLYSCCETAKILNLKTPANTEQSFSVIFNQIILTSLADPFRMTRIEILKLHQLMAKYKQKVIISLFSEEQKKLGYGSGGLFYMDLTSENLPVSLDKKTVEERTLPNIRLMNTHLVLASIEDIFQSASSLIDTDIYNSEIQLLKKVIPHLNNSYERQSERISSKEHIQVVLVKGLKNIYKVLQTNDLDIGNNWEVNNRGIGGIMVNSQNIAYIQNDVNDFYGIFEKGSPPLLANVRWLNIENDNTRMGLELLQGIPVIINHLANSKPENFPLLFLRNKNQADTLLAPKGLLNIDKALELTENDKTYIISVDTLIDNSFNYDHFSFTTI